MTMLCVITLILVTSDFVYVRFIGDRSIIQEKDFGHIQIGRIKEMKKVAHNFKTGVDQENLSQVKLAIVASNNHYAGFGPGTVNNFRQLLGLKEVKWIDIDLSKEEEPKNRSLDNYVIANNQVFMIFCRKLY
jgi:hypothetical protein